MDKTLAFPGTIRKWSYRKRSLANLLRMGHCGPTVMKTLLEVCDADGEWAVKLAGVLPGGIGDTGFECGGITSPLFVLGLRYGLEEKGDGLPLVFHKGLVHLHGFLDRNGSPFCSEIRGTPYRLRKCMKAVCLAPEIALRAASEDGTGAVRDEAREAYALLYSHLTGRHFHCARTVLEHLGPTIPQKPELREGLSDSGRTLCQGMTCGALVAGHPRPADRIENSLWVMRMIVLKTAGRVRRPHQRLRRIMNRGNDLANWFAGNWLTQCKAVTDAISVPTSGISPRFHEKCAAISEVRNGPQHDAAHRIKAIAGS
jgi:C_GCAxxG_C_C family probable redox protein